MGMVGCKGQKKVSLELCVCSVSDSHEPLLPACRAEGVGFGRWCGQTRANTHFSSFPLTRVSLFSQLST